MNAEMQEITIYTKVGCPYCVAAKQLLTRKGVDYVEINISRAPAERPKMIARAKGRSTVPQIFVGSNHVGGCDDLYALDEAGRLDPLIVKLSQTP